MPESPLGCRARTIRIRVGLDDQERHGHRGQHSRSHSTPIPSAQANALGGGISLARNDPQPTTSPLNDSTFAGNSATASYTGTGTGLAQAVGGAIGGSSGLTNSAVYGNSAVATGSGTGVPLAASAAAIRAASGLLAPVAARVQRGADTSLGAVTAAVKDQIRAAAVMAVQATTGPVPAAAPRSAAAVPAAAIPVLTSAVADGGGVGALSGPASNSTISGNSASSASTGLGVASTQAGGIAVANALANDTVAGNTGSAAGPTGSAVSGGGTGTSASLANTIVAGNAPTDCQATTGTDIGGNLDSDGTCGLTAVSGSVSAGTANLGLLRNNGGTTRTLALRAGSQAIALGIAATCEQLTGPTGVLDTDQRGNARNSQQREACDSGAFDTGG